MSKHQLTSVICAIACVGIAVSGLSIFARIAIVIFIILCWITIAALGSFSIESNYHVKTFCGNPKETRKRIAITFDDGPSEFTAFVLDILKQYSIKATFFCIGKNVVAHPELLKRIINEGHIAGNHTYNHSKWFSFYRKNRVIEELQETNIVLERITRQKPVLFRPPYGVTNPSIRKALKKTGHQVIGWNMRSLDTLINDEEQLFTRIKQLLKPGGILLLHDTSLHTVHVLERLLQFLKHNGYEVVTLKQLRNGKSA